MDTRSIEKHITIHAPEQEVWDVLVNEQKIREWAAAFGEGMHAETDWAEGSEIRWKNAADETCGTGIISVFRVHEVLHVDFFGKTNPNLKSPTGRYSETYSLKKAADDIVELHTEAGPMTADDFIEQEGMWEKALQTMKAIAER